MDRTQQPPYKLPLRVSLPECGITDLANGISLYEILASEQDVIRLSLIFTAGTRHQSHPFVASTTLNMLSEGSLSYSSAEIAEQFDFYGIYYDTSIDRDYSMITISFLGKFANEALALLDECLLHPEFSSAELSKYTIKRKQNLRIDREKPSMIAREEFSRALFSAEHPYGVASHEEEYDNVTTDKVRQFYDTFYNADNCFAVTSGMVTTEQSVRIRNFLSKIPVAQSKLIVRTDTTPIRSQTQTVVINREEATQSSLRVGKVLFAKSHEDFNAMQFLMMVLGGYFGSRLVDNLREEKGYTYGVYAAMVNLELTGYFAIATDVAVEHTQDAMTQIIAEIERLRNEPIDQQEIDMVRNIIVGEMMRILDGPFGIADVTIESVQCGISNDNINQFLDEIRTITPERLQTLAIKYLDPETLTKVIVGKLQ